MIKRNKEKNCNEDTVLTGVIFQPITFSTHDADNKANQKMINLPNRLGKRSNQTSSKIFGLKNM